MNTAFGVHAGAPGSRSTDFTPPPSARESLGPLGDMPHPRGAWRRDIMTEPRFVLALIDPIAPIQHAATKAAVMAIQLGATLCLLHVLPTRREGGADDTAFNDARAKLSGLAERLGTTHGVTVACRTVRGDAVREILTQSEEARLLVVPSPRRNTLREVIFGNPVERLIRLARVPVLVVKQPLAQPSYSHVLVPIRLTLPAIQAVATAAQIAPSAAIHVLHVVPARHDVIAEIAQVPAEAMQRRRDKASGFTRSAITRLLGTADCAHGALPLVGFGDSVAATLHKAAALGADLIAIGRFHRKPLARFLMGRFTQQILAQSDPDVLVVPIPAPEQRALTLGYFAAKGQQVVAPAWPTH